LAFIEYPHMLLVIRQDVRVGICRHDASLVVDHHNRGEIQAAR